ncbi:MAG: hypothetical protein HFF46_02910 [Lawsonibacter sp.]|nr:hypothetical protein [Lawsonibacter sp.]
MPTYTWSFAQSFLIFLMIVFASQSLAAWLRSLVPMPLFFGVFFAGGFALGWLPRDLLLASNMVAVGTIAFNVLVIHSGTMVDLALVRVKRKEALTAVGSALVMTAVLLLVLPPLIGRDLALLVPGAVVGGGASCAIGSRWVSGIRPDISFFPWMIFMFQGLFSVPVVTWALKKESARLVDELSAQPAAPPGGRPGPVAPAFGPVARIPQVYKTPAYYLGLIMAAAVLNYALQGTVLAGMNINLNITALLLGILAGNLGLIDRAPLFKCDSYGLLILSLMGLMANNLANTPLDTLLSLTAPVLIALAAGTAVLTACGAGFARLLGMSPYEGIILAMNSVMGFPVNQMLVSQAAASAPEHLRGALTGRLTPLLGLGTMLVSNGVSIFTISILVSFVK